MALEFIIALVIVALFQILGGGIAWIILKKFDRYNRYALLAAMFLMIIIVSELMKEGFAVTWYIIFTLLTGMLAFYLINKFVPHKHEDKSGRLSKLVFISMIMHELPEGLILGSSYLIDPSLGIAIAILVGLHNIPEGGIVALPYLMKKKTSMAFKTLVAVQLAFILGGLLTYVLFINLSQEIQAYLMTFAAGMMLFIVIEQGILLKK